MRIGQLAKLTGTTARALRHYEQAGLISSKRAANGYRVYSERTLVRVRNIRYLLAAGLTLEDVRFFLPCLDGDMATARPSAKGLQVAWDRLATLNVRIAAQIAVRDRLEAALRQIPGQGNGGRSSHRESNHGGMPKKIDGAEPHHRARS